MNFSEYVCKECKNRFVHSNYDYHPRNRIEPVIECPKCESKDITFEGSIQSNSNKQEAL